MHCKFDWKLSKTKIQEWRKKTHFKRPEIHQHVHLAVIFDSLFERSSVNDSTWFLLTLGPRNRLLGNYVVNLMLSCKILI